VCTTRTPWRRGDSCPGIERLAVIPNARAFEHCSEYLASPRMLELVTALEAETPERIIIYDTTATVAFR
jgi:hypothetical protein